MYKELFLFHLKTMALFKKSSFSAAMSLLSADVTAHVDSFNENATILDHLLKTETFAATQELKEGMIDGLGELPILARTTRPARLIFPQSGPL